METQMEAVVELLEEEGADSSRETTTTPDDASSPTPSSEDDFRLAYLEQLRGLPDLVPELIGGSNLAEIAASLEQARAIYQRIAGAMQASLRQSIVEATPVTAGGFPRHPTDLDLDIVERLDPVSKIAYGIARRK